MRTKKNKMMKFQVGLRSVFFLGALGALGFNLMPQGLAQVAQQPVTVSASQRYTEMNACLQRARNKPIPTDSRGRVDSHAVDQHNSAIFSCFPVDVTNRVELAEQASCDLVIDNNSQQQRPRAAFEYESLQELFTLRASVMGADRQTYSVNCYTENLDRINRQRADQCSFLRDYALAIQNRSTQCLSSPSQARTTGGAAPNYDDMELLRRVAAGASLSSHQPTAVAQVVQQQRVPVQSRQQPQRSDGAGDQPSLPATAVDAQRVALNSPIQNDAIDARRRSMQARDIERMIHRAERAAARAAGSRQAARIVREAQPQAQPQPQPRVQPSAPILSQNNVSTNHTAPRTPLAAAANRPLPQLGTRSVAHPPVRRSVPPSHQPVDTHRPVVSLDEININNTPEQIDGFLRGLFSSDGPPTAERSLAQIVQALEGAPDSKLPNRFLNRVVYPLRMLARQFRSGQQNLNLLCAFIVSLGRSTRDGSHYVSDGFFTDSLGETESNNTRLASIPIPNQQRNIEPGDIEYLFAILDRELHGIGIPSSQGLTSPRSSLFDRCVQIRAASRPAQAVPPVAAPNDGGVSQSTGSSGTDSGAPGGP